MSEIRVVIDTNVLVSALLSAHGAPGTIIQQVLAGRVTAVFDDRMLSEYREVLARPRLGIPAEDARLILDALEADGLAVSPQPLSIRLPDPDDLAFLEVAAWAHAPLVTGNGRHFVPLDGDHGVVVLNPASFLREMGLRA